MDVDPHLGEQVRLRREQAGLTRPAAARLTDGVVSVDTWKSLELGRRYPTLTTLQAVCAVLEVQAIITPHDGILIERA